MDTQDLHFGNFIPKDADYEIRKHIQNEKARKAKEWDQTKSRLEKGMQDDMLKRKHYAQNDESNVSSSKDEA